MSRDHFENRNLIHEKLRQYRLEQGMSQQKLAEEMRKLYIPMSRQTISRIENNTRYVLDYEVLGFSLVFAVHAAGLFGVEEWAD